MGLFNKKTIETDLSDAQTALAESTQKLTAAETHILELEETNGYLTAERDAAKLEAQNATEAAGIEHVAFEKLSADAAVTTATVAIVAAWFGEGEISAASLDKKMNDLTHAKALEIAAGQGCPAVPSDPSGTASPEDETKAAMAAAAEITDPRERAQAFAAINAKLNADKK